MNIINKSCPLSEYMDLLNSVRQKALADRNERHYCLVSDDTMTIFDNGEMIGIVNQLIATDDVYIGSVFDVFVLIKQMNPSKHVLVISAYGLMKCLANKIIHSAITQRP